MTKDEAGQDFGDLSKLKPGAKGEITIDAGIYKGRYPSRLEDVRDGMIALACPLKKGVLVPVYRDMDFTFTMEDSAAQYNIDMTVRRIDVLGGVPLLWAMITGELRRIQRRQFLRISCLTDVSIFPVEAEVKTPMNFMWKPAKALDMSLRGTRFKLDDETAGGLTFESGNRLMIRFQLFDKEYILLGKATRIAHADQVWEVGLAFDSVALSVEKKLFEFIRQQEMMGREG